MSTTYNGVSKCNKGLVVLHFCRYSTARVVSNSKFLHMCRGSSLLSMSFTTLGVNNKMRIREKWVASSNGTMVEKQNSTGCYKLSYPGILF